MLDPKLMLLLSFRVVRRRGTRNDKSNALLTRRTGERIDPKQGSYERQGPTGFNDKRSQLTLTGLPRSVAHR